MIEKMIIYHRRKIILAILEKLNGSTTAKCLQKYLFLFTRMQRGGERFYDFIPYRYGCFSFVANNDILALIHQGFIRLTENPNAESTYTLTSDFGMYYQLDFFEQASITEMIDNFSNYTQDELIAYTYKKWPITAVNSIIKEHLLNSDELAAVEEARKRYRKEEPVLMTLGYEGISIEKYINQLLANDIRILCDVRKNAYSQKYGFSKTTITTVCNAVGLRYVHIPQLGIESDKRKSLISQADYDALFDDYERTTLLKNRESLFFLRQIIEENSRVCLLCFERDPRQCHRTRIANAIMSMPNVNFKYTPLVL